MFPILFEFTFWSLVPVLLAAAGACLLPWRRCRVRALSAETDEVADRLLARAAGWKSLATTFLLLAASAAVGFLSLGIQVLPLSSYGALLVGGMLTALALGLPRARRLGVAERDLANVSVLVVLSGLVGARIFFLVFEQAPSSPLEWFAIWQGGMVLWGGMLASLLAAWWYTRRRALPLASLADAFIPGIALGIGLGRVGCFLYGCCYGAPTAGPLGLTFPAGAPVYHDFFSRAASGTLPADLAARIPAGCLTGHHPFPVHPTQLYEAAFLFLLAFLLWHRYRSRRFQGEIILLGAAAYGTARFLLEYLRVDTPHDFFGIFSLAQAIGLVIVPIALFALYVGWNNARLAARQEKLDADGDGQPRG